MSTLISFLLLTTIFTSSHSSFIDRQEPIPLVGYTELRTDIPQGRHANIRTMRAMIARADGKERREIGAKLVKGSDAWTQFAGWSPDGKQAILIRGWESEENAKWEEEHKAFRFAKGQWLLDTYLYSIKTGKALNVTAVERVSEYNAGLFFLPNGRELGFTALIEGVSKPFLMNLDGTQKRDVSNKSGGFAYGYSASPDGKRISYHQDYQIYLSNPDGSDKRKIETGNPFNFGPQWSPDGEWLLFLSGVHGKSNPYIVRRDGTGLRQIANTNGYQGWILFLDVPDFHQGSSDLPVWAKDGRSLFYTAKVEKNVELFQTALEGQTTQLTKTAEGTLHYHPQPSPDGKWLAYGSLRAGVRQLYIMRLSDKKETRITNLKRGYGALWLHWQPLQK
jgi:Tol biopolymer transport system component